MRKYYWVWLYQVKKGVSYLESDEISFEIQTVPNVQIKKIIEAPHYLERVQMIMVERITPFHVREVRTGIIFPILNIKNNVSYLHPSYHKVSYPFGKVHTFVFSQDTKLIGREVQSSKELELYNREHLFPQKYKQELNDIIAIGKSNMNEKIQRIYEQKLKEQACKQQESDLQKQERAKTKKLIHQFRHDRKSI